MTYKAWNLPYNEISYISYLSLSKHLFWVIESLYSLNWCFLKNSMHFLSILRRVRLCHILPSYINFSRGYYSINSSNAVFATILIAPLPIRSYNDSKYVLTNRSRKEKMYSFIYTTSMVTFANKTPGCYLLVFWNISWFITNPDIIIFLDSIVSELM